MGFGPFGQPIFEDYHSDNSRQVDDLERKVKRLEALLGVIEPPAPPRRSNTEVMESVLRRVYNDAFRGAKKKGKR